MRFIILPVRKPKNNGKKGKKQRPVIMPVKNPKR